MPGTVRFERDPIQALEEVKAAERFLARGGEPPGPLLGPEHREALAYVERMAEAAGEARRGVRRESIVLFIVGEWGLGKTLLASLIEREARRRGLWAVRRNLVDLIPEVARRLAREEYGAEPWRAVLEAAGVPLGGVEGGVLILDEVERVLEAEEEAWPSRAAARALLSLIDRLLYPPGEGGLPGLSGRLHLVLLVTPQSKRAIEQAARLQETIGKVARRYSEIVLRPLPKHRLLGLLDSALRRAGPGLLEVFEDPRLAEALYYASGGNPGIALDMLATVLRRALEEAPGRLEARRIDLELLLSALEDYKVSATEAHGSPINRAAAASLRDLYKRCPRTATALGAGSYLEPGEDGDRYCLDWARSHGLEAEARPLQPRELDAIQERLESEACRGDPECSGQARLLLSLLTHLSPRGGVLLAVPAGPGELEALAGSLIPDQERAGLAARIIGEAGGRGGRRIISARPEYVSTVYQSRQELYSFIRPGVRGLLLQRLNEMGREELEKHLKAGMLELLDRAICRAQGAECRDKVRFTYRKRVRILREEAVYPVPVSVHTRPPDRLECLLHPQVRLLLEAGLGGVEPPRDCPGLVVLRLPSLLARQLALVGLAVSMYRGEVDRRALGLALDRIARILGVEAAIRDAVRGLEESGAIVEPLSPGLEELARARLLGGARRVDRVLGDIFASMENTLDMIAALNGHRRPIAVDDVAEMAGLIVWASPYTKGHEWCRRIPSPRLRNDIKDLTVEAARGKALQGLEGLRSDGVAMVLGEDRERVLIDPSRDRIYERILRLARAGASPSRVYDYFILPEGAPGTLARGLAERRLALRLDAYRLLRGGHGALGSPGRGRPRVSVEDLRSARKRLANLLLEHGIEADAGEAGSILLCKSKGCKPLTSSLLEGLAEFIDRNMEGLLASGARLAQQLLDAYEALAGLMLEALQAVEEYVEGAAKAAGGARRVASRIRGELEGPLGEWLSRELESLAGGLLGLASRGLRVGDEIVRAAERAYLEQGEAAAKEAVERLQRRERLDLDFDYSKCGRQRRPVDYSPHKAVLDRLGAPAQASRVGELARALEGLLDQGALQGLDREEQEIVLDMIRRQGLLEAYKGLESLISVARTSAARAREREKARIERLRRDLAREAEQLKGEAEKCARAAERILELASSIPPPLARGGDAGRIAREAREALLRCRDLARYALETARSAGGLEAGALEKTLRAVREARGEAGRLASRMEVRLEAAERLRREAAGRVRERQARLERELDVLKALTATAGNRLGYAWEAEFRERHLEGARRLLAEARRLAGEGRLIEAWERLDEAERAVESAREALWREMPREVRGLVELAREASTRGLPLGELLSRLRELGYEDAWEGLEQLEAVAERMLGRRIIVRAE